jgi:hypothetical protein
LEHGPLQAQRPDPHLQPGRVRGGDVRDGQLAPQHLPDGGVVDAELPERADEPEAHQASVP